MAADHPLQRGPDVAQQLLGRAAVERQGLDAGDHLPPQSGHLDLEELVDPLAEQDQELDPLEQRDILVGHQVEQPVVEVEVGELAGEEPGIRVRAWPSFTPRAVSMLIGQRYNQARSSLRAARTRSAGKPRLQTARPEAGPSSGDRRGHREPSRWAIR